MREATVLPSALAGEDPAAAKPFAALLRYGLALVLVVLAWAMRLALDPWLGDVQVFAFFYVAVALTAWWVGWRPALLTLGLGYLAGDWFFLPPRHAFGPETFAGVMELVTYLLVAGTVVALISRLRKAERAASANAQSVLREKRGLEAEMKERRKAEAALAESQRQLEHLVQVRTAKLCETVEDLEHFSYSIVHDMRAPLRAMQSYAALLEEELAEAPAAQRREFLQRIQRAAQRMDHLIQDSLNYTKILREELPLKPVPLGSLLRGIVESYPGLQPEHADIRLAPELPTVVGNEAALTHCLSNLLGNAVKFVSSGTRPQVRVWAETVPAPEGEPANPPWVRLWIADNGIGIPKASQARIFQMFQRLHTESEYPGTGIGLAIVRKAVQRIGGRVGVESEPGQGSRFWLELPWAA